MEAQRLYQYMFCENCGKCNGDNIKIVENEKEKLKTIKCSLMYQDNSMYNKEKGGTNEKRNS